MSIARESYLLVVIGMADLVTTLIFMETLGAQEANPLFQFFWHMGWMAFILAKAILLVGPILLLEFVRRRKPRLALTALRTAMVAYLVVYGIGVARINSATSNAAELAKDAPVQGYSGLEALPRCYLAAYTYKTYIPSLQTDVPGIWENWIGEDAKRR